MIRLVGALTFWLPLALAAVEPFDHAGAIRALDEEAGESGGKLYALHCAACHGEKGDLALNPLARRFARDPFKFGHDPYALWKTISYGNGLMFRWDAVLSSEERYQIVHHLRENIIRPHNPSQYFEPDESYFETLNERAAADAEAQEAGAQRVQAAPGMLDGSGGIRMQYGSFLQHAVVYGPIADKNAARIENATEKALIIDLPGNHVMAYDTARLSVSGIWSGDPLADTSDTHLTSYKGGRPVMPSGELHYHDVDAVGWRGGSLKYKGHYVQGERVVLDYAVGDRAILESPSAVPGSRCFVRTLRVAPGNDEVTCLVARRSPNGPRVDVKRIDEEDTSVSLSGDGKAHWLTVPASTEPLVYHFLIVCGGDEAEVSDDVRTPDLEALTKPGPRRWPLTVQTAVAVGESIEGYAADELTVPLANPYGSWMRLTALGFFSDGRLAVSTLSGDVWLVTWSPENPHALTWSRFASGLYEPLGLEIIDDVIYVRGRDRITRLHDENGDGEADFYESFYEEPQEIGAGYHAFSYDLVSDAAGYLYYAQGAWKSPLPGAVIRVSPDGNQAEMVARDLRNPNGLGAGGPNQWITVADNPSGVALYNGFTLVREGGRYGFESGRSVPMLVVLPARVDSSSGGQCWSDPLRWGPLSEAIVHTSYSRSAVFYCLTQDLEPFPNGFAVRFPFDLEAGPMRARVNPVDGQVYLACKRGWDSIARLDGVIYRLRYTGESSHWIEKAAATASGIRLTFASELDAESVSGEQFRLLREPDKPTAGAADKPAILNRATLIDPRTVELEIPGIQAETLVHRTGSDGTVRVHPAISITAKLRAADGVAIEQTIHATINALP